MPKASSKSFATPKKQKKVKAQNLPPETEDEYFESGTALEEAGEKWQGGDAAKASRFFVRAIQNYDEGLAKYSQSFDMAYNKARIQYHITQRPSLLSQTTSPLPDLLHQALQSHQVALSIDPSNADVQFNTAQVLSSLAEAISDSGDDETARVRFGEALELFSKCLARQEALLAEKSSFLPSEGEGDEEGGVSLTAGENEIIEAEDVEQYASVVEPVTEISMVETCVAALDALAILCGLETSSLETLEEVGTHGEALIQKLEGLLKRVDDAETLDDARCARVKFGSAFLEAQYAVGDLDAKSYSQQIKSAVDAALSLGETQPVLCCAADAYVAFSAALANTGVDMATSRWTKLAKALDYLTAATKLEDPRRPSLENAGIHVGRGDVELSRFSLCIEGSLPESLSNSTVRATLLKNAETYYRGAMANSKAMGQSEVELASMIKLGIVDCLRSGKNDAAARLVTDGLVNEEAVKTLLQELVDESIVLEPSLRECGLL